jgi:hypothetical protein
MYHNTLIYLFYIFHLFFYFKNIHYIFYICYTFLKPYGNASLRRSSVAASNRPRAL